MEINKEAFRSTEDLIEEASVRDEMLAELINSCDLEVLESNSVYGETYS